MRQIIIALLLIPAIAFASADNISFKDAVVVTTVKKRVIAPAQTQIITPAVYDSNENIITPAVVEEIEPAVYEMYLDLPFPTYSEAVVCEGKDITYSYRNDASLEDKEVMANINYSIIDRTGVSNDEEAVREYPIYLNDPQSSPYYAKHWPIKKSDAWANYDEEGTKVPYAGKDKDEYAPFCVSSEMR